MLSHTSWSFSASIGKQWHSESPQRPCLADFSVEGASSDSFPLWSSVEEAADSARTPPACLVWAYVRRLWWSETAEATVAEETARGTEPAPLLFWILCHLVNTNSWTKAPDWEMTARNYRPAEALNRVWVFKVSLPIQPERWPNLSYLDCRTVWGKLEKAQSVCQDYELLFYVFSTDFSVTRKKQPIPRFTAGKSAADARTTHSIQSRRAINATSRHMWLIYACAIPHQRNESQSMYADPVSFGIFIETFISLETKQI